MPKRSVIVYGNCQALFFVDLFNRDPAVSSEFRFFWIPSFKLDDISAIQAAPLPKDVASATLLLEQSDQSNEFLRRGELPPSCRTVRFPPLFLVKLWPFDCPNPFNVVEPPEYPYGRFMYGDRIIFRKLDEGCSADEALDYYLNCWNDYAPDFNRLSDLEAARARRSDSNCDVHVADLVLGSVSTRRGFWSVYHPHASLFEATAERITGVCARFERAFLGVDPGRTMAEHPQLTSLYEKFVVPIHPKVARAFQLEWYDPAELYGFHEYSYEQYFKALIDYCIAHKNVDHLDSLYAAVVIAPSPPISGPVNQLRSIGYFRDGFMEGKFSAELASTAPLVALRVRAYCPPQHSEDVLLRCAVADATHVERMAPGTAADFELPLQVAKGVTFRLTLTSSRTFNMAERRESEDSRDLSVVLQSLELR